jgi:hypothetical protein
MQATSVVTAAERKKLLRHPDVIAGVDFVPVAIETSGVWSEQVLGLRTE